MAERPEDLNLPNAVITRIIKEALPDGVNVSKEARRAISQAASVFVLYATSWSRSSRRNSCLNVNWRCSRGNTHSFSSSATRTKKIFREEQERLEKGVSKQQSAQEAERQKMLGKIKEAENSIMTRINSLLLDNKQ